jgi:transcriptional regulator GlxA family with amidase domain
MSYSGNDINPRKTANAAFPTSRCRPNIHLCHPLEVPVVGRLAKDRHVVIAAYPGVSLLDLGGPLEAFCVASAFGGQDGRRVDHKCTVVSSRGGRVDTADGVPLFTKSIRSLDRTEIDILVLPGAFLVEDVTGTRNSSNGSLSERRNAAECVPFVWAASCWRQRDY